MFVRVEDVTLSSSGGSFYANGALRTSFEIPGGKQNAISAITGGKWKVDVRKPLSEFGRYMMIETDKTFRNAGRGQVYWAPLKRLTQIGRVEAGFEKGPALTRSGGLKRSTRFRLDGSEKLSLYSKHPLARIHHEGAHIPAGRTISAKNAKSLRWFTPMGTPMFAKWAWLGPATIPARPFLFFIPQDEREAMRLINTHIMDFFVRHA